MKKNIRKPIKVILALLLTIVLSVISFETALAADPVTVNIPVYKAITGDTPAANETFRFRLAAVDNAPMPAGSVNGVKTVTISGTGNTTFGTISYINPGNYNYTISEIAGSNAAYTYDKTVYELCVQVTWKDEAGGELQAVMYLVKQGGQDKQERAMFVNEYTRSSVTIDPPVKKVISGDAPSTDSIFTFYLKANDISFPMPSGSVNGIKSLLITGDGVGDFGEITYTQAGVYTYTVYERDSNAAGYTYDTTVYTMTVTVIEENGRLSIASRIIDDKGALASDLIFTNRFSAGATPTPSPGPPPTSRPDGPKTGDESADYIWWIILGLAVIGIGAALWYRRRQER
jgi:pilin isopeptide linkage protein/LPXTG-motif cell wall-anchored protein